MKTTGTYRSTGNSIMDKDKGFECSACKTRFSFRTNLNRHIRTIHNKDTVRVRSSCVIPGCSAKFYHQTKLLSHLETAHGKSTDKTELTFLNLEEFLSWKMQEEAENFVCFTKQRGDINHLSVTHQHYICQRDGSSRRHSSRGQRSRKTMRKPSKGVIKTDLVCPARMLVRQCKKSGGVNVSYYKSHSHPISSDDTIHHPLPPYFRNEIKSKLKSGISVNQIYQEFQRFHKAQLVTRRTPDNRLSRITKAQIRAIQRRMDKKATDASQRQSESGCIAVEVLLHVTDNESNSGNEQLEVHVRSGFVEPATQNTLESVNNPGITQEFSFIEPASVPVSISTDSEYGTKLRAMLSEMLTLMESENVRKTMLPCVVGNMEEMLALCQQEANSANLRQDIEI